MPSPRWLTTRIIFHLARTLNRKQTFFIKHPCKIFTASAICNDCYKLATVLRSIFFCIRTGIAPYCGSTVYCAFHIDEASKRRKQYYLFKICAACKSCAIQIGCIFRNCDFGETCTVLEYTFHCLQSFCSTFESYICKLCATVKGISAYPCDIAMKSNVGKLGAIFECAEINYICITVYFAGFYRTVFGFYQNDIRIFAVSEIISVIVFVIIKLRIFLQSIVSNRSQTRRQCYIRKICASADCISTYAFYTRWNNKTRKACALAERISSDATDAFGHCNAFDFSAIAECMITDTWHTTWNRNGFYAVTIIIPRCIYIPWIFCHCSRAINGEQACIVKRPVEIASASAACDDISNGYKFAVVLCSVCLCGRAVVAVDGGSSGNCVSVVENGHIFR